MKNTKRSLVTRVVGGILGGVIGLTSFSVGAGEVKGTNNSQVASSVTVSENEKQSERFYRTKTGKCYHKDGCSYLKDSKIEVTDKEIKENELNPCSRCCKNKSSKSNESEIKEDKKKSVQLYRTKTGKCYHNENCKCLRNSKIKVSQEEIKEADLRPCSKCCK